MAKADSEDTAFKVGDEVVRTGRLFELHEIIKQLPSGERQYRIGPPPIRSQDGKVIKPSEEKKLRDVRKNELMRLDEVLDGLLDDAKARKGNATRNALLAALSCARNDYRQLTKKLPPAEFVARLEKSIANVRHCPVANPHHRQIFDSAKTENRSTARFYNFQRMETRISTD